MQPRDVEQLIEQGWAAAAYPGDDRLAGSVSYCPSEYTYVADFFKGKHWSDVTLSGLRRDYAGPPDACLSFMSGEALRFYLPAFMLIAMRDYPSHDIVCDSAVAALTPPTFHHKLYELAKQPGITEEMNPCSPANVARQREWWKGRMAGLTRKQWQAIVVFLTYMDQTYGADYVSDLSGPKNALEYWHEHPISA